MNSIVVGIAEFKFAESPNKLVSYGLGSCVAIVLYSREVVVGAMAHVMLPLAYKDQDTEAPGKFADSAVEAMVRRMEELGITVSAVEAKMAGGADMFAGQMQGSGRRIGARNILAARRALDSFGVRLTAQDVGGTFGRTVQFDTKTGLFTVRTLKGNVKEL